MSNRASFNFRKGSVMIRIWMAFSTILPVAGCLTLGAAEEDPLPPPNRPDREALRERAKNLAPEERQKMIREFREKHGLGGTNRSELERRREEIKKLSPEQREAKLKELRQSLGPARREFRLNQQQRDSKRNEIQQRINAHIADLEKRKAEGVLSEPEQRRLQRMHQMSRRLAQKAPPGSAGLPPPKSTAEPGQPPAPLKPAK
jgi:hypothetical protein